MFFSSLFTLRLSLSVCPALRKKLRPCQKFSCRLKKQRKLFIDIHITYTHKCAFSKNILISKSYKPLLKIKVVYFHCKITSIGF